MTSTLFDTPKSEVPVNTGLVEHPLTSEPTPMLLIQRAMDSGIDPGKLMDLAERWEANRAAEAFSRAITQFQAECPRIEKSRTAKIVSKREGGGQYEYKFAGFDDVMKQAGPALEKCGIAVSFSSEHVEGLLKVTCRIRHGIHVEDHTLTVPIPAMNVNDTQRFGAALSYAKRYALCAALNIIVSDDVDNDAAALVDTINEKQLGTIEDWMGTTGVKPGPFLRWLGIERMSELPVGDYEKVITELQRKAREQGIKVDGK